MVRSSWGFFIMGATPPIKQKYIETPEKLYQYFSEYKEWVKQNPYKWHDFVGKDAEEVWKLRQRPLTWIGFEGYLAERDIISHLGHYEQNTDGSYEAYLPTIARIKRECSSDVVSGALAGVYQQNVATRVEGLTDKREVEKKVTKLEFKDAQ